jgi:hypothetical protein
MREDINNTTKSLRFAGLINNVKSMRAAAEVGRCRLTLSNPRWKSFELSA